MGLEVTLYEGSTIASQTAQNFTAIIIVDSEFPRNTYTERLRSTGHTKREWVEILEEACIPIIRTSWIREIETVILVKEKDYRGVLLSSLRKELLAHFSLRDLTPEEIKEKLAATDVENPIKKRHGHYAR